jgi:hypothetical protein
MSNYLLMAVGVIFLTITVSLIVPEGKLSKIINFVMRLVCILALIQPALQLFNFANDTEEIVDYNYISAVFARSQGDELERIIYENFEVECDCVVSVEYDGEAFNQTLLTITFNERIDDKILQEIYAYLTEIGYININVNEKTE